MLDRASGLWGLVILSLAMLWWSSPIELAAATIGADLITGYGALLVAGAIFPLAFGRWRPLLVRTLPPSILVQAFSAVAFWACLQAVGSPLGLAVVAAVSAAVFVAATLPTSIGGFGARELAAVAVLGVLGVGGEPAFAASVLLGLTHTVIGLVGIGGLIRARSAG